MSIRRHNQKYRLLCHYQLLDLYEMCFYKFAHVARVIMLPMIASQNGAKQYSIYNLCYYSVNRNLPSRFVDTKPFTTQQTIRCNVQFFQGMERTLQASDQTQEQMSNFSQKDQNRLLSNS